jgi:two-component system sensor kinase FixL
LSAVGELATGIAHELNQPLATIVNYAESARLRLDQDPASGSKETSVRLEKIAAQATRAGEIIHRMRHLWRYKEPQWSVVDLNECATVIGELIKPEARLKGVSVRMRLADENPAVSGDGIQIQQVFLNLVRNGMDAIADRPADGHTLTITTELVDNALVRCSVCDSGAGLSDDKLDSLFEPFNTTKSDGLGLGLSVSRWIIEAHRGQISAARRPGGGAVFSFVLPVVPGDDHGGR